MVNRDAAFAHHPFEVAIADGVAAVPAHRPEHDLPPEVAPLEIVLTPTPRFSHRRQFAKQTEICNRAHSHAVTL